MVLAAAAPPISDALSLAHGAGVLLECLCFLGGDCGCRRPLLLLLLQTHPNIVRGDVTSVLCELPVTVHIQCVCVCEHTPWINVGIEWLHYSVCVCVCVCAGQMYIVCVCVCVQSTCT